jgi:hypothetical protein
MRTYRKTILIFLFVVLSGIGTLAQETSKQNTIASAQSEDLKEADRLENLTRQS